MITFRKLSADSKGAVLRAYFTENTPDPIHDLDKILDRQLDPGGRLTAYYTERDSRASWRPDMPHDAAQALGIDPTRMPKNAELDRLFEGKRADTGEPWSEHKRKISAYDFTFAPHKSVTLAAEFAATPAESASIWHAIDRANDATMRYIAREIGWARKGAGGEDGADPGTVGWVSFRHHVARPTLPIQDGKDGATYLVDVPIDGDPHAHIHNAMFNMVVTGSGRIGSLDTARLQTRVHEFGAYGQARLADELRRLGIEIGYDRNEQAVVVRKIPQTANDLFSKSHRQVLRNARDFVAEQGLDWEMLSAERKQAILSQSGVAARLAKTGAKSEREIWRAQAEAIGWQHRTVLDGVSHPHRTDTERYDAAYEFAARHLAQEFETAAVIDHDKLRLYAARGLIGTGIAGGTDDIDRVVELIEERGLELRGEHVALLVGVVDDKVRVTNTAQVRIEEALMREVRRAALDRSGALSTAALRRAIGQSGLDFRSEPEHGKAQLAAIYALGQGGAITLLTGVAGAGKTTLLQPLVSAWQADNRYDPTGRQVVGIATAWRQADALKDAGIGAVFALQPLLYAIEAGEFRPTRNTVLVIDELSQIGPRSMLKLLELQAQTGMTIKGLADPEQAQAIEAGSAVEIMRRALPKEAQPEILTTVRQASARDRTIAGLFRESNAHEALAMKREDGTAQLVGGDHDQVLDRIAEFYLARRDLLRASGSGRGITVSVLTNEDAADISRAVRRRLKERGEIGGDEKTYKAVAPRGPTADLFDLPIAIGDRLRLYRRTWGKINGQSAHIGNNGDIVEVVGHGAVGIRLRNKDGRVGDVDWRNLSDERTGRLMLGFGHALTIDAAQGITADEHINALPRGSAGITAFKGYVAESRARYTSWTMVSEAAVHDAEKRSRALGDARPVTHADLWQRIAEDMSEKPYKALGIDLLMAARERRDRAIDIFLRQANRIESWTLAGMDVGKEVRDSVRANKIRNTLGRSVAALDEALQQNAAAARNLASDVVLHLRGLRGEVEAARYKIEQAAVPAAPAREPGSSAGF
jgi:hypothetical protein